ncbi:hypothetical protein XELAEV_18038684mg [Xenopus laevis]|uniref:Uncharacterized protein n=1 Tax=Xenopus laevis TaxID=8355 RepID=A0A974C6G5_XENLA|nr:hypothetical protein XELAEV_18038684mg [Xenopus laevis]
MRLLLLLDLGPSRFSRKKTPWLPWVRCVTCFARKGHCCAGAWLSAQGQPYAGTESLKAQGKSTAGPSPPLCPLPSDEEPPLGKLRTMLPVKTHALVLYRQLSMFLHGGDSVPAYGCPCGS